MEEFKIKNETGLELTITTDCPKDCYGTLGGDKSNPTWEEYLSDIKDEYKPHFELLKRGINEVGWLGEKADKIANYYCFVFSDGFSVSFSWRAWGDLMQAIVNKKEGYMTYYM